MSEATVPAVPPHRRASAARRWLTVAGLVLLAVACLLLVWPQAI